MGESRHARASRPRRRSRIAAWVLGAVVAVAVLAVAWVGIRGYLAYEHLTRAQAEAATLADDLTEPGAASARIDRIAAETAAAHALTSDPIWDAAEHLPWLGPQLSAVGVVAAAAHDVAGDALGPLSEAASSFSVDALRPQGGTIDVSLIARVEPAARAAASGLARASASVDGIDESALLTPLRAPIAEVKTLLGDVSDGADALARATELMPAMLGAEGPRTYLVVFQNNAEWRSLGGIVGAMAVVSTDGGRMTLTAQGSSSDFRRYDDAVVALGDDALDVYGRQPALYIQNATQVADFSLAARIAREMWLRETGQQVDGVLAVDPVALSYLLTATGPVTLPSGDVLTSENAVDLLLNGVYERYERPADQDAFFEVAAGAVFAALSSGAADPTALVSGLARAGDEDRLLLWSAHDDEQSVLDGTTLQGGLPVTDEERTGFGVYLNDATGSKMDYYLTAATGAAWCTSTAESAEAELTLVLRNGAPADAASLPDYITGGEAFGVPAGSARTVTWFYLPIGAQLVSATTTDGGRIVPSGSDGGRDVLAWNSQLAPGEEQTATVRVLVRHTPALEVRTTPTVYTPETIPVSRFCEFPG